MIYDPELRKSLHTRLKWLNEFIRSLEDFGSSCKIDVKSDKVYVAAVAQKKILRDLIDNKFH
jgi:hypothetical protein